MGKTQSTQKTVESSGEVNNNVVINEPMIDSSQMMQLIVPLWILCAVKILELVLFLYKQHHKQLKKKYASNPS